MHPTIASSYFGMDMDVSMMDFRRPVCLHLNAVQQIEPGSVNILCVFSEPEAFRVPNDEVLRHADRFDHILAWDPVLLNSGLPTVHRFVYGTTWISPADRRGYPKVHKTTFLCGLKSDLPGHQLRQALYARQGSLRNIEFWRSSAGDPGIVNNNPLLPLELPAKIALFRDAAFHVAIENARADSWFTEKLVDCLVTKTCPIYWGAPNIGEYFDTRGMIIVQDLEDLLRAINSADMAQYDAMEPYIQSNFNAGLAYARPLEHRLQDFISELVRN